MISNHWYVIYRTERLRRGSLVGIVRFGERYALWRTPKGVVGCVKDVCPHRGASISQGTVLEETVQCPFHGLEFTHQGTCRRVPAMGSSWTVPERYHTVYLPVQEAHGFIWAWYGESSSSVQVLDVSSLPPIPFFDTIDPSGHRVIHEEVWPVHYTRCIENQLDVLHLPFVHASTIGRGGRTVVNGPKVVVQDTSPEVPIHFHVYVDNQKDSGQVAVPPKAYTKPIDPAGQHLEFIFPHLWQNYLFAKMQIMIAFVPVDEGHTLFYMSMYQSMVKIPGVRWVFDMIAMGFNRKILHQDRDVVVNQRPIRSELRMGEHLVQGDDPILFFRKCRDASKRVTT